MVLYSSSMRSLWTMHHNCWMGSLCMENRYGLALQGRRNSNRHPPRLVGGSQIAFPCFSHRLTLTRCLLLLHRIAPHPCTPLPAHWSLSPTPLLLNCQVVAHLSWKDSAHTIPASPLLTALTPCHHLMCSAHLTRPQWATYQLLAIVMVHFHGNKMATPRTDWLILKCTSLECVPTTTLTGCGVMCGSISQCSTPVDWRAVYLRTTTEEIEAVHPIAVIALEPAVSSRKRRDSRGGHTRTMRTEMNATVPVVGLWWWDQGHMMGISQSYRMTTRHIIIEADVNPIN